MIKILTAQQTRQLDAYTIQHEPVTSVDLMERAAQAFVQWFVSRYSISHKIGVVCGTGNNGGDGLAIARLLETLNYTVQVWVVRGGNESADFKMNEKRLTGARIVEISSPAEASLFSGFDILIDALFGSGLSRPVEGIHAQVIDQVNQAQAIKVAVDIPSGIVADQHSSGKKVEADFTLSFQLPKLAFMMPENQRYVGDWKTVPIGLDETFIAQSNTSYFYSTEVAVKRILRPRKKFDHKGDHGKALLIAGSYGKMGACILSSRAILRSGIGLLTVHIPASGYSILQTAVPEAMVSMDSNEHYFATLPDLKNYDVIGIGPGLGQQKETINAFTKVLEAGKPMVIDADALNILGSKRALGHLVPAGSILTPHPKEFERMVGKWTDDFDRLEKQKALAKQLRSVVILKGAHTSVATAEGKVYFNSTGNPGMATGGSGDVLTGILTSLLAQHYPAEDAAVLGVYLHGAAGDEAAKEKTVYAMMASDLYTFLPAVFRSFDKRD